MRRFLPLVFVLLAQPALSQDGEPAPETEPTTAEASAEGDEESASSADVDVAAENAEKRSAAEDVTDEEIDALLDLDEPWDEDAEDEFIPTENVKFEQSIPFPTDI